MYLLNLKYDEGVEALANMIDPLSVILADKEITDLFSGEGSLYDKVMRGALPAVTKCMRIHKAEILVVLSTLVGEDPEEYRNKNMLGIIADVVQLTKDPQIQELFTSAQSEEI